jgi:polar amino acid transport system substrate-binding protein
MIESESNTGCRASGGVTMMKKRVLAGVLSAAMAVSMSVTMVYAGETEAVSGTEAAANADGLATEGKFVVGFDAEYPPYGYMDDNGDYTGFDLELAQAVCDLEGWELVKTPIDWDSKDMELNSGNIDCIWNGFTMNGREDSYTFSVPYVNNSQVIVTADDSGINSLADLAGKTVGVQADSAALALLSKDGDQADLAETFGDLQQFADYNTAFTELMAGSLDAVAIDIGVAQYQINGRDGYKILDEYLNAEQYAVGFKKGNTALCDTVNKDLKTLLDNGTFDKIAKKYAGQGVDPTMLCLRESFGEATTEASTEAETEA